MVPKVLPSQYAINSNPTFDQRVLRLSRLRRCNGPQRLGRSVCLIVRSYMTTYSEATMIDLPKVRSRMTTTTTTTTQRKAHATPSPSLTLRSEKLSKSTALCFRSLISLHPGYLSFIILASILKIYWPAGCILDITCVFAVKMHKSRRCLSSPQIFRLRVP
jgi:hypothetical protein